MVMRTNQYYRRNSTCTSRFSLPTDYIMNTKAAGYHSTKDLQTSQDWISWKYSILVEETITGSWLLPILFMVYFFDYFCWTDSFTLVRLLEFGKTIFFMTLCKTTRLKWRNYNLRLLPCIKYLKLECWLWREPVWYRHFKQFTLLSSGESCGLNVLK